MRNLGTISAPTILNVFLSFQAFKNFSCQKKKKKVLLLYLFDDGMHVVSERSENIDHDGSNHQLVLAEWLIRLLYSTTTVVKVSSNLQSPQVNDTTE